MRLSTAQQENLLVLLCFDADNAPAIRGSVGLELWEGDYRKVAERVYDYLDRYSVAPGEHTADLFEDLMDDKDHRRGRRYRDLLAALYDAQEGVNPTYIMGSLATFVRRQTMRAGLVEAVQIASGADDEETLDRAESVLVEALKPRINMFDPGLFMSDQRGVLQFMQEDETDTFTTGIPQLDLFGQVPARGELWLFIAAAKRGKSWSLINLAKRGLMHRARVCYISLELSTQAIAKRMCQSIWAIPKRRLRYSQTMLIKDSLSRVVDIDLDMIDPKIAFDDVDSRRHLQTNLEGWSKRLKNMVIKQFAPGTLTINGLRAYLDMLDYTQGFTPDLLLIDYADEMATDVDNYRISLRHLYKDLRGVAVSRNIAVATASQANRAGSKAKRVGGENVAEDWSKIGTVDCAITYSQTDAERELGLARLYVAASRRDKDRYEVLITQNYDTGQFALESAMLSRGYFDMVKRHIPDADDVDDDAA